METSAGRARCRGRRRARVARPVGSAPRRRLEDCRHRRGAL